MLEIPVPGRPILRLEHLVCDYNGTLAVDGAPLSGVLPAMEALSGDLVLHVITADTHGDVRRRLAGYPCTVAVLPPGGQDIAKRDYLRGLDPGRCAALGNGRNDRLMLREAALGIAVLLKEGLCVEALQAADLVVPGIVEALELLAHPLRLAATLRC
jgi:soluble P-type ATPase